MSASRSNASTELSRAAVGDTDGDVAVHSRAVGDTDRLADRRLCTLGHRGTGCRVGTSDHHRELVAAEAGNRVAGPQQPQQSLADDLQHDVAGRMAEAVVDQLEVVEIEAQHRHGHVIGEGALDLIAEQCAVAQAGQPVVRGLVQQQGAAVFQLPRHRDQAQHHQTEQHDGPAEQHRQLQARAGG